MKTTMQLIYFLDKHPGVVATLTVIIGGFWPFLKFVEYLKDKRFNTYHKLINDLVNEQAQPGTVLKLDRQIAIIYELRNFPSYYPVTRRILTDLKLAWANQPRAIKEIDFTLNFLSKNWLIRSIDRLRGN